MLGRARYVCRSLWSSLVSIVFGALTHCWSTMESWLLDAKRARYGLAITRIMLGATAVGLLASNWNTRLYAFGSGSVWNGEAAEPKSDFPKIWFFSAFHRVIQDDIAFTLLYLVLIALGIAFMLGWRFRIVLPVFFCLWVGFIESNDMLGDQGDNMYRIVLILMFFADPAGVLSMDARRRSRRIPAPDESWLRRKWHGEPLIPVEISNLLHNAALIALAAQVFFVYVSGSLYKVGGLPWSQAYAIYNPLQTDRFGTWPILSDLITAWGPFVALLTWGSLLLQLAFPLLLLSRPTRILALLGVLSFHIGIGVVMGLPWFSLTMIALDAIFIRDSTYRAFGTLIRNALVSSRTASPMEPSGSAQTTGDRMV
jgi:hypothetical protein